MKERIKTTIIISIILFLVFISILFVSLLKNKNNTRPKDIYMDSEYSSSNIDNTKLPIVTDRNDFFTVQSCIDKYIYYLVNKDVDSLYKLLDESYIKKYNITKENVLEYVENISEDSTVFKAKEMYFEKLDDYNFKYHIKGENIEYIRDEEYIEINTKGEFKLIVNMDKYNMLFSIVPYGYGGIFNE